MGARSEGIEGGRELISCWTSAREMGVKTVVPSHFRRLELRAFLKDEIAEWGKVVKAVGVKLE